MFSLRSRSLLLVFSCLSACAHPEDNRWSSFPTPTFSGNPADPQGSYFVWNGPSVAVYSYPVASPAAPTIAPPITSLSAQGQAALIRQYGKYDKTSAALQADLAKPFGPSQSASMTTPTAKIDETFSRVLVATISEGLDAGPADRIVWAWIDIKPLNFVFDGYTIAATDNETLNITTISDQTAGSLQGQLGENVSNTNAGTNTTAPPSSTGGNTISDVLTKLAGSSVGVTANLSNSSNSTASISQEYEKLHVDILPLEMRIFRESERNLDIAGNTLISLSLHVDSSRWIGASSAIEVNVQRVTSLNLVDKNFKPLSPSAIGISTTLEKAPPNCPLIAQVTFIYEMRKVDVSESQSYLEGNQSPTYVRGEYSRKFEIVPKDEVRPPSWEIYPDGNLNEPVQLEDAYGNDLYLDFANYDQAQDFAGYLNSHLKWVNSSGLHSIGKNTGYTLHSTSMVSDFEADRVPSPLPGSDVCPGMETKPVARSTQASPGIASQGDLQGY